MMSAEPLARTAKYQPAKYDPERTEEDVEPLAPEYELHASMTEEEWAAIYSSLTPVYEAVQPPPGVDPDSNWHLQLTDEDLPFEDGIPMDSWLHARQLQLLADVLRPEVRALGEGFVGDNMFVYYAAEQVKGKYVRGPDLFVSLGVSPRPERKSYVVWQEGKPPDVVIELLSLSTAKTDKTIKKAIYQDDMQVAEYYWFDPYRPDDFAGFVLENGVYRPMERDAQGRYVSGVLGLLLTRWEGEYEQETRTWLRWARPSGELVPTPLEALAEEARRADDEARRADDEARRADDEARRAEAEARRADDEARRADDEARRADDEARRAEAEAGARADEKKRADREAKARIREEQKRLKAQEQAQLASKARVDETKRANKAEKQLADMERKLAEMETKLAAFEANQAGVAGPERQGER